MIRTFPKVTIAVVNGFCLGGITLLLPHDLAIASNKAQFGLPETNLSNRAFGSISRLAGDPRVMQFALRATF